MHLMHIIQFLVYSVCVNLFSLFIYVCYYTSLFTSVCFNEIHDKYDFIIVGSGTAGSLIAHRLATETNYTYIVLEAGGHSNPILDIPIFGPLLHGSEYDWQYMTVPQKISCFAMKDNKCRHPLGKIVGGSSKLNNMVHIRGNITHYAKWFHGKYPESYFLKQFDYIENHFLHLDDLKHKTELSDAVLCAAKEMGLDMRDVNKDFGLGFMGSKVSQKNGKRWATSDNVEARIVTNALVEKVIFDKHKAVGVRFIQAGVTKDVYADHIIISAGTFNSPKILQLSGIGPKELLDKFDIPIVRELPVGMNLQDHVTTGLDLLIMDNGEITAADVLNPMNVYEYFVNGRGALTSPGCEVVGFVSTENTSIPDVQLMFLPVGIASDRGSHLRRTLGIKAEVWDKYFAQTFSGHTASMLPILLHPKSKGLVQIDTKDPFQPPLINPMYLSNEDDINRLVYGLKFVLKMVGTKAMRDVGVRVNRQHFPGCESYEIFSDEYLVCYIKHLTLTSYHPVGSCSLGLPDSRGSVVDTSFKVIGVESLYVVDGSVLPSLPSGNINAAIAMMANIFFDTVLVIQSDL